MLKRFFILVLAPCSLALAFALHANTPSGFARDFEQPVQILADNDLLDLQQSIYRAMGNVRINQGSLQITADELEVTGFDNRSDEPEVFSLRGSPATYQQEIEPGIIVNAQATTIQYDSTAGILTLQGGAELRQDGSLVRAERIIYNIETQQVTSDRGEEQVETIFRPRPRTQQNNGQDQ
ncbi:lipopolysaccharide transport periplasmic protein LptA [Aliidiomarina halalkaliphila]|uniref:Lipopolysaccharide export system protein LptA n=1 Tax=Aliidiomarina halalkaliphila TaxID=2593535 RepID=A0A552X781_9GAMM|nr:lipopolysaccharide transport periplasmic protein LptA [Aliidiomarina halalkaliphila]TRW50443.1 lipopolysaccharide transport periplasmic protein LptA [Aliidiomarina halalkaliphila]